MRVHHVVVALMLGGLLVGMVAGCGSKVSKSNFDKIKADMTRAEVESILGKPDEENTGGAVIGGLGWTGACTWTDGGKKIVVTFVNDKVTVYTSEGI